MLTMVCCMRMLRLRMLTANSHCKRTKADRVRTGQLARIDPEVVRMGYAASILTRQHHCSERTRISFEWLRIASAIGCGRRCAAARTTFLKQTCSGRSVSETDSVEAHTVDAHGTFRCTL